MKYQLAVQNLEELSALNLKNISHIVLSPKGFSRFGSSSLQEVKQMIEAAAKLNKAVIIEWDSFCHESQRESLFYSFKKFWNEILNQNKTEVFIKVTDPGVALFCARELENVLLQLNLETSFHNLPSILGFVQHPVIGKTVRRVTLSQELPWSELKKMAQALHQLHLQIDILVFGRILLFSTPRELLSAHFEEILKLKEELQVEGQSEESPHKGFPIVQNKQGTFMFNTKDLCLVDVAEKFQEISLDQGLLDFRFENSLKRIELINLTLDCLENFSEEKFEKLKNTYQRPTTRGFFLANKSDVLLPKLKNGRLQDRSEKMIGQIVDVDREAGRMAILLRESQSTSTLATPLTLKMVSPVGKEKIIKIDHFEDAEKNAILDFKDHHLLFVPWVSSMTTRSNVFVVS